MNIFTLTWKKGVTLVEILIALTLFSLFMGFLFRFFYGGIQISQETGEKAGAITQFRRICLLLREDLQFITTGKNRVMDFDNPRQSYTFQIPSQPVPKGLRYRFEKGVFHRTVTSTLGGDSDRLTWQLPSLEKLEMVGIPPQNGTLFHIQVTLFPKKGEPLHFYIFPFKANKILQNQEEN